MPRGGTVFPKRVNCDRCGAGVVVRQSIPVFEMEVGRASGDAEPKSWFCIVKCPGCGERSQYVERIDDRINALR
jgi:ribosomal protein S27E